MTKREREQPACRYCNGTGELHRLDYDPIQCPSCKEWPPDEPRDPEHHALRSEEMENTR